MGVDKMGVDEVGVDEMGSRRSGTTPLIAWVCYHNVLSNVNFPFDN